MNTHAQTYEVGAAVPTIAAMFHAPYGTVATDAQGFTYRTIGTPLGTTYIQIRSEELATQVELHPHQIIPEDLHAPLGKGAWTVSETPPAAGLFWSRTAEEWQERATDCYRRRQESWERSDTDGFMSQWAAQEMAAKYEHCASIATLDGTMVVRALFDLTGHYLPSRLVQTDYGPSWGIWSTGHYQGRFERWFRESGASTPEKRRANEAKKGIYVGTVRVRAALDTRTGDPFATPDLIEIVDNGVDPVVYGADEQ